MVGVSEEFFLSNLPMVSRFQFDTYRHDMSVFFNNILCIAVMYNTSIQLAVHPLTSTTHQ